MDPLYTKIANILFKGGRGTAQDVVMLQDQQTADSPPLPIEESLPDLSQKEESPPSTFLDLS
jgi:hypothetical protein